ncbi:MAG: YfiT family bacillithiol transferase [Gemmatimonadota bacterium]
MTEKDLEMLRYPVGRFARREDVSPHERTGLIDEIAALPVRLRRSVTDFAPDQLDAPYRPDGWTVRQVVHHVADSHVNAYVRFKLALTEERPTIKPYDQTAWAELPDARTEPVEISLDILDAVHHRWTLLLRTLNDEQWSRVFRHPEIGEVSLDTNLQLYAWHGRHHLAHVTTLAEREGWS